MPKIPLPAQAAPVGRTSNLSPVSGGQIMSPSSGDRILSAALGQAQQGITAYGSAVAEFQKKQQDTENMLASAEAKNLYTQINDALIRRMAENPGAFNDFEKWSNEADELYRKQEVQFTDRMTPEFRRNFSLSMQGTMLAQKKQRIMTGIQAKVTADYNRFQNLFKDAAQNNPQQALALLEQHRGGLISEQEYLTKKEIDLPKISQYYDAVRKIDGNTDGVISLLEQRDKQGNYVNFTAIAPEQRRALLAYANAKDSARRSEENTAFYDMLVSGAPISRETVEASFEGRTSPQDLRQKQEQLQMVDRMQSARERAVTAANEKKEKDAYESFLARIVTMTPPAEKNARAQAKADIERTILARFTNRGSVIKRLKNELDETFKAVDPATAGQSYKNSYVYQYASNLLSGMKKDFHALENEADRSWWNPDKEDSREVLKSNYKMAQIAMDAFIKNNPNATNADVEAYLEKLKAEVNKTEVGKLVGFWTDRVKNAPKVLNLPEKGAVVDGYIFLGGRASDRKNWKKQ